MRKLIRSLAAAVCVACLAVSNFVMTADSAMAQDQAAAPVKQMALTKKQIEGVLAAQKDMNEISEKQSEHAMPYLIVTEQLESAAKKHGFASYDEYNNVVDNVVDNVSLIFAGFDLTTKKYIGREAVIRAQIAQVEAVKNVPVEEKKETLAELNNAVEVAYTARREQGQYRPRI